MSTQTWTGITANTGALRTAFLSKKLYEAAIAECVFVDHCNPQPGFGAHKGQSVTIGRRSAFTEDSDASLSETDRIPEATHAIAGKVVTVSEFGRAIVSTNLAHSLSQFDLNDSIQSQLKEMMKLALDTRAARAFKQTLLLYVPTGATAATTYTNGTAATPALVNMNVYHCEEIRDLLYDTYRVPMIGDSYVGIFRTLGLRGIKRDPDWEQWKIYTNPQAKYNSEVGRLEEIRFIETNHGDTTPGTTGSGLAKCGTSDVLGEGVIFGQDAVRMLEVQTPGLRVGEPQDFGRQQAVAWYGIYEFSAPVDTANAGEVRTIFVTSST
jgi:N4-gp56 family major capsid protein